MLDLRRLEMLLEVARTGSFAGAAESLSFTPSAVSQQMGALERAAGMTLFERSARGVRLTPAARTLRDHAQDVVTRLADAYAELDAMSEHNDTRLRFGSFSSATGAFAADAFCIFAGRYPDSVLSFSDGEPYETLAQLARNELDLTVIFQLDGWRTELDYRGVVACGELELECVHLFDDPYLLIMPSDHDLAVAGTIDLGDVGDVPILAAAPWHRDLEKACTEAGHRPRLDFSCRATGFEALQALVAAGRGVSLMPRLALGWLRQDLVARPIAGAPVRHVQAATQATRSRSSASQAMLEILIALTASRGLSTPTRVEDYFRSGC
ncbi:LysR family transcriptional regulator [soil metagenome]